nr:protein EXORDIUM-like 3 [Ipomoea batatas]
MIVEDRAQIDANISQNVILGAEKNDGFCSHGKSLIKLMVQSAIKSTVTVPSRLGGTLSICDFLYFTFPSIVNYTLSYAEIAELSTSPLVNAWYALEDPSFPIEITNLCEGIYYTCDGGCYTPVRC